MKHFEKTDRIVAAKLFVTVYLLSGLFFKPQLYFGRFEYLTKALVHYGTTSIDAVERETGITVSDRVVKNGRTYIAVTPGLSYLSLVTYWPYARIVRPRIVHALDAELDLKLSQYVMALGTVIPAAALACATLFLTLRLMSIDRSAALLFSLLLYGGTPVVYYSLNITNGQNVLEMSLLLLSYLMLVVDRKVASTGALVASGVSSGFALFANVSAVLTLPVAAAYLFLRRREKLLFWLAGLLPGVLGLLVYNLRIFQSDLTAYNIVYRGWVPLSSLFWTWQVTGEFLVGPRLGLLFYCPFLLLMVFAPIRRYWPDAGCRALAASLFLYVAGYSVMLQVFRVQQAGESWYLTSGGGGVRYLLPVVPFLVMTVATVDFSSPLRRGLAAALMLIACAINLPGLFWTGGQAWFLNNLLLFLKNGFNSYAVETVSQLLAAMKLNTAGMSLFPPLACVLTLIWWMWHGNDLVVRVLANRSSRRVDS